MSSDVNDPASDGPAPVRVLLELDLEAQPIEGNLGRPGGPSTPFVGWLGLTAALEGLRRSSERDRERGQ